LLIILNSIRFIMLIRLLDSIRFIMLIANHIKFILTLDLSSVERDPKTNSTTKNVDFFLFHIWPHFGIPISIIYD
jgi:hypothetical protein